MALLSHTQLQDKGHGTSARTAVGTHEHFVLMTFHPAGRHVTIGTNNPNRAVFTYWTGRTSLPPGALPHPEGAGKLEWRYNLGAGCSGTQWTMETGAPAIVHAGRGTVRFTPAGRVS